MEVDADAENHLRANEQWFKREMEHQRTQRRRRLQARHRERAASAHVHRCCRRQGSRMAKQQSRPHTMPISPSRSTSSSWHRRLERGWCQPATGAGVHVIGWSAPSAAAKGRPASAPTARAACSNQSQVRNKATQRRAMDRLSGCKSIEGKSLQRWLRAARDKAELPAEQPRYVHAYEQAVARMQAAKQRAQAQRKSRPCSVYPARSSDNDSGPFVDEFTHLSTAVHGRVGFMVATVESLNLLSRRIALAANADVQRAGLTEQQLAQLGLRRKLWRGGIGLSKPTAKSRAQSQAQMHVRERKPCTGSRIQGRSKSRFRQSK